MIHFCLGARLAFRPRNGSFCSHAQAKESSAASKAPSPSPWRRRIHPWVDRDSHTPDLHANTGSPYVLLKVSLLPIPPTLLGNETVARLWIPRKQSHSRTAVRGVVYSHYISSCAAGGSSATFGEALERPSLGSSPFLTITRSACLLLRFFCFRRACCRSHACGWLSARRHEGRSSFSRRLSMRQSATQNRNLSRLELPMRREAHTNEA